MVSTVDSASLNNALYSLAPLFTIMQTWKPFHQIKSSLDVWGQVKVMDWQESCIQVTSARTCERLCREFSLLRYWLFKVARGYNGFC
jgi:hypothetical protein